MKQLIEYSDYRDFIKDFILTKPKKGRGYKKELADFLCCQSTHISQVLAKRSNLTLEQGIKITQDLRLNTSEKRFFMILLNISRAGSMELKDYYENERIAFIQKQFLLAEKAKKKKILNQNQINRYYSNWFYPAIHVLLSVPQFQNVQALIDYLPLAEDKIMESLNFLIETGLARRAGERYVLSKSLMEQPQKNSDPYKNFLKNWRNQAILSIDGGNKEDIHNSIIFSLSQKDSISIQNLIQNFFNQVDQIIPSSREEMVKTLSIDFFSV